MISSVGTNSSMAMISSRATQRQPPPPAGKNVFDVADTNKDGTVSSTELSTLTAGIEKITGNSIDATDAMSTYDTNGDGALSGKELSGLMSSQGFNPAQITDGQSEDSSMMPPPPPMPQAISAYGQNSSDDSISQLIELLKGSSDSEDNYSALTATA